MDEEDDMVEALEETSLHTMLQQIGLQKAVPVSVREIKQLDSHKRKKMVWHNPKRVQFINQ